MGCIRRERSQSKPCLRTSGVWPSNSGHQTHLKSSSEANCVSVKIRYWAHVDMTSQCSIKNNFRFTMSHSSRNDLKNGTAPVVPGTAEPGSKAPPRTAGGHARVNVGGVVSNRYEVRSITRQKFEILYVKSCITMNFWMVFIVQLASPRIYRGWFRRFSGQWDVPQHSPESATDLTPLLSSPPPFLSLPSTPFSLPPPLSHSLNSLPFLFPCFPSSGI